MTRTIVLNPVEAAFVALVQQEFTRTTTTAQQVKDLHLRTLAGQHGLTPSVSFSIEQTPDGLALVIPVDD